MSYLVAFLIFVGVVALSIVVANEIAVIGREQLSGASISAGLRRLVLVVKAEDTWRSNRRALHVDVRMVVNLGERHLAVGIIDHEGNVGVRDRVVTPSRDRLTALTRLVQRY